MYEIFKLILSAGILGANYEYIPYIKCSQIYTLKEQQNCS